MKFKRNNSKQIAKTTLKGLFGAIPYVGNFLDEVIYGHLSRIKQDRINKFVENLSDYFEENSDSAVLINFDKLNIDEFSDIFERIIYSVSKSSSEQKLNIFRSILVKRIESKNASIDLEKLYVDITNSISEMQFVILNQFASLSDTDLNIPVRLEIDKYKRKSYFNFPGFTAEDRRKENRILYEKWKNIDDPNDYKNYSIGHELFLIHITDLVSKGLLFDFTFKDEVVDQNKFFGITIKGRGYIEYVSEKTADSTG